MLYFSKSPFPNDFKRLKILCAQPGPLEPEELRLPGCVDSPLLLLLTFLNVLVVEGFLQPLQPQPPLLVLVDEVAVVVLQGHLRLHSLVQGVPGEWGLGARQGG